MNPDDEPLSPEELEQQRLRALQEAEDAETFGMEGIARTGDVSVEETNATNRKLIKACIIVGIISVTLVACIGGSIVGYLQWSQKPLTNDDLAAKKKTLGPPKETQAMIKTIDRERSTIEFLVGNGKYPTYQIRPETDFYNAGGQRLSRGFDSPEVVINTRVVILPAEDNEGLQWLKLTK